MGGRLLTGSPRTNTSSRGEKNWAGATRESDRSLGGEVGGRRAIDGARGKRAIDGARGQSNRRGERPESNRRCEREESNRRGERSELSPRFLAVTIPA